MKSTKEISKNKTQNNKLLAVTIVIMMVMSCLTACQKQPKNPITVKEIQLEDITNALVIKDEILQGLVGRFEMVNNNTQNDRSETRISYQGESQDVSYQAEYLVYSQYLDGGWHLERYERVRYELKEKQTSNEPDQPKQPDAPDPIEEVGSLDEQQIITLIEDYYLQRYEVAQVQELTIESPQINAVIEVEDQYRYVSDIYRFQTSFSLEEHTVHLVEEETIAMDTISNFEGDYINLDYDGHYQKGKPYIQFTRDWQFRIYIVAPKLMFDDPIIIGSGSYSIDNATLTMKPKDGWYNGQRKLEKRSEIWIVPHQDNQISNFIIQAITLDEVIIEEKMGDLPANSHFKKVVTQDPS